MFYYSICKYIHVHVCITTIGTVRVKKNVSNIVQFGFNELGRNGMVPAHMILRKRRLPFHFVSFQLHVGQVARSRADASKMTIASGVTICTTDGLPPPTHFPRARSLVEVCLLACDFLLPCSRSILHVGAASVETA